MFRRYIPREKTSLCLIPQFDYDPYFIAFRSWTATLSLEGAIPYETRRGAAALFLDEEAAGCRAEVLSVRKQVCLRNPTRITLLNVTIVHAEGGQKVFFARELPAGRFLHLEFLKEGSYTLHYSPAFSNMTLHRNIRTFLPERTSHSESRNFHPSLKSNW